MMRIFSYGLNVLFIFIIVSLFFKNPLKEKIEHKLFSYYLKEKRFDINQHYGLIFAEDLSKKQEIYCKSKSTYIQPTRVKNASPFYLISSKDVDQQLGSGVNLSYRIFDASGTKLIFEGSRSYFQKPLEPNGSVEDINLQITCPELPGDYQLRIELVQEGVNWQSHLPVTSNWISKNLHVVSSEDVLTKDLATDFDQKNPIDLAHLEVSESEKDLLKKAFQMARNILLLSAQAYTKNQHIFLLSNAGSIYPMSWMRDMASIEKAYHNLGWSLDKESHFSEVFFEGQALSGSIPDWASLEEKIDGHFFGKNSIQSDQELWLINSILKSISQGYLHPEWLTKKTKGVSHIKRMQRAFEYLLDKRFDPNKGCLASGHIADWGDVGLTGDHEKTSTKLESNPQKVCGIFIQSLFVLVANNFLNEPSIKSSLEISKDFRSRLQHAKSSIEKYTENLWNEKNGYYTIHKHLDPIKHHGFSENEIFALGGNLLASEAFPTRVDKNKRIAEKIRQNLKNGFSIGTTLIPSYPDHTFENPIMDQSYEYQNGADWDWFGSRAARLLYSYDKKLSLSSLVKIAERAVRFHGFYEWYDKQNKPQGSGNFQASAAEFINALSPIQNNKDYF